MLKFHMKNWANGVYKINIYNMLIRKAFVHTIYLHIQPL